MRDLNPVRTIPNLRDLGGVPASANRVIRSGIVFRAAAPSSAAEHNESISAALTERKIQNTYDLRSLVEVARYDQSNEHASGILPPGVERIPVPVFKDQDYSPEANAVRFKDYADEDSIRGFTAAYKAILEAGSPAFGTILKHLAVAPPATPAPLLVHCTAGKDRTGVIAAIILSLCGVKDEAIAEEYGLTQEGLTEWRAMATARLLNHPALKDNPDGIARMLSAKPENMLAALKMLREEYGSVEDYVVNKCGLTTAEVTQLRENMTVPA
ncbi:hypothetical protein VHEMI05359 [[Torrubiella] hemipterigena]|uniref:Tyrosine specific protein phosphatases domain-containing protein n=1 Tax=[Torrubiella] hemipterigena TaxID=1531966 RepID=A0A0A1TGT1_9HYPO|nr:hypothetical protein VHEMI05359 [[Torrubiella] hemipterigena]